MGQYEVTVELRMLWAPPVGDSTVGEAYIVMAARMGQYL